MACNEPAYADVGLAQPRWGSGSSFEPAYESVFRGGSCTVWDLGATTWDGEATTWDCAPPERPLYAPSPVEMPSYRTVIEGGVCTVWDLGGTTWDEYEVAGVSYFTRWDCGGNPPSDDLEDVCQP